MYVKKWVAFASIIAAASLPAYGNSAASMSQDPVRSRPNVAVIGSRTAIRSEGCLLFRSTLQDAPLNSELAMAQWQSSWGTEPPIEQERTTLLPEPGSGVLLSIGALALIWVERKRLVQEIAGGVCAPAGMTQQVVASKS